MLRELGRQVVRFILGTGVGTALYWALFLFYIVSHPRHYILEATAASVLNYGINFGIQRVWVFENKRKDGLVWHVPLYMAFVVALIELNNLLLVELIHRFGLIGAQVRAGVVLGVVSFPAYRLLFHEKTQALLRRFFLWLIATKFPQFAAAGVPGTVLYFVTLYLLVGRFGKTDIVAWTCIASFVNYFSNSLIEKWLVFENKEIGAKALTRQGAKYIGLFIFGTIANMVLLQLLVTYTRLWYMLGPLLVGGILTLLNFFGSRRIFRSKKPPDISSS